MGRMWPNSIQIDPEQLPDALVMIDPVTMRIQQVNRCAEEMFGDTRDQLVGRPLHALLPDCPREAIADARPLETRARRHDGSSILVDARFAPMPPGPQGLVLALLRNIEDRTRVEQDLKRANAFLDAIVENVPDMIFVKNARTFLFEQINRAGLRLLGWSREDIVGKTDGDFLPREQADFVTAKDREALRRREMLDIPEEPIQTRAGGVVWLHTRKVPVFDEKGDPLYVLGISEDITARKAAEARATALAGELASVVRDAREAIVTWKPDGRIATWNPAAEALYGQTAAQAIGTNIEALVPESSRTQFQEAQARVLAGEKLRLSEAYRLNGGNEIEVEESLFAIHDGPDQMRIASVARDVAEVARLRRASEILSSTSVGTEEGIPRGSSARMRETLAAADIVAESGSATVLLLGETGVGKSWLARRIHNRSPRADKPFFELNCASLDPPFVESELFGHERGAFTGADTQKRGIVEVAAGGTVFLDEVAELSATVQARLLTFLESRTFRRLGSTRTLQSDVRVLAATNADLKQLAERGKFRRDLYYRLRVVPIEVPPLRERREEIPMLARQVLQDLAGRGTRKRVALTREVAQALSRYDWPGNVRELRNALERAFILGRGEPIVLDHLPPEIRGGVTAPRDSDRLDTVERAHIEGVLERVQGNRTRAARALGISRSTLKRKLAKRD